MKDIVTNGLQQTTYSKDDMEKKIVIKEQVNINPHLKHNKALYNYNDGYSKCDQLIDSSHQTIQWSYLANSDIPLLPFFAM